MAGSNAGKARSGANDSSDGIGARILEARERMGLTQKGLGTRSGISRTVIVGYEAGDTRPGAREIKALCEALAVTPNWLLYGRENPFEAIQASTHMFPRSGVAEAVKAAFVLMALRKHERDHILGLVLSLAGRQLTDRGLSALTVVAAMTEAALVGELLAQFPELRSAATLEDALPSVIARLVEGISTNYGNKLRLDSEGRIVGGEWLYGEAGASTPPKKSPRKSAGKSKI